MDQETQMKIVQERILAGQIQTFDEIFRYVQKTAIHQRIGGNYYRLLRLIKAPKGIKFEEVYGIANAIDVPPRAISDLIHKQIENTKPARTKK